jgi:hypothetical protein
MLHSAEDFVLENKGLLSTLLDHICVANMMYDLVTVPHIANQHLMSTRQFRTSLAVAFTLLRGCRDIHAGDVNTLLDNVTIIWKGRHGGVNTLLDNVTNVWKGRHGGSGGRSHSNIGNSSAAGRREIVTKRHGRTLKGWDGS